MYFLLDSVFRTPQITIIHTQFYTLSAFITAPFRLKYPGDIYVHPAYPSLSFVNAGISGYIFKDDQAIYPATGQDCGIVAGGEFISARVLSDLRGEQPESILTPRQLQALLCARSTGW